MLDSSKSVSGVKRGHETDDCFYRKQCMQEFVNGYYSVFGRCVGLKILFIIFDKVYIGSEIREFGVLCLCILILLCILFRLVVCDF